MSGIIRFEDNFAAAVDHAHGEAAIPNADDYLMIVKNKRELFTSTQRLPKGEDGMVMVPWDFDSRVDQSTRVTDFELASFPFEATASLNRDEQSDLERIGFFFNKMTAMGQASLRFDNEASFGFLLAATGADTYTYEKFDKKATWSTKAYDKNRLFGTHDFDGLSHGVNLDAGGAAPWWFLVDPLPILAPVIYGVLRMNEVYEFEEELKKSGRRRWGQDGRAGFAAGNWRAVYASNQDMTLDNVTAAREATAQFTNDDGTPAQVVHTQLIVGASNELKAREALKILVSGGETNILPGLLTLTTTRWLP